MFGLPYPTDHEHFSVLGIYHRRKILLFDVADSSLSSGLKTTTTNKQTNKQTLNFSIMYTSYMASR